MAVALLWPLQHLSWLTGADRVWTRRDLGFSADLVRQELETSCVDRCSCTTYIDYIVCDVLGNVWDLYGFMSDLLSFCILHMPVEDWSNNDPMLKFDPCSAVRICMKLSLCQDVPQETCPAIGTRYFGAGAQKIRGASAHVPRHAQTYCVAQPSLCHVQHPRRPQTIIPTMMSVVTTWWFCWGAQRLFSFFVNVHLIFVVNFHNSLCLRTPPVPKGQVCAQRGVWKSKLD